MGGVLFRHPCPQQGQLFPAGHVALQRPKGLGGQGRTVGPDLIRQIAAAVQTDVLRGEGIGQRAVQPGADGAAVEGQHAVLGQLLRQEIGQLGNTGLAGAHQVDTAARQLPLRLKEVAAVRPQGGLIRQDHQRAGRAGEAGEIFPGLEVVAHILRAVEVVGDDQTAVKAAAGQLTAQQGDTVRDGHSYITPFLIWVEYTIFSGGGEWFFWRGLV